MHFTAKYIRYILNLLCISIKLNIADMLMSIACMGVKLLNIKGMKHTRPLSMSCYCTYWDECMSIALYCRIRVSGPLHMRVEGRDPVTWQVATIHELTSLLRGKVHEHSSVFHIKAEGRDPETWYVATLRELTSLLRGKVHEHSSVFHIRAEGRDPVTW